MSFPSFHSEFVSSLVRCFLEAAYRWICFLIWSVQPVCIFSLEILDHLYLRLLFISNDLVVPFSHNFANCLFCTSFIVLIDFLPSHSFLSWLSSSVFVTHTETIVFYETVWFQKYRYPKYLCLPSLSLPLSSPAVFTHLDLKHKYWHFPHKLVNGVSH